MAIKLNFNTEDKITDDICMIMQNAIEFALQNEEIKTENFNGDMILDISFVDAEAIKKINNEHRSIDSVTDVLSFPQYENPAQLIQDVDLGDILLGDVVICNEVAKKQAEQYNHSYEREIVYLFVHSIFHLLGYDHIDEAQRKEMRIAEENVLRKLDVSRDFKIEGDA